MLSRRQEAIGVSFLLIVVGFLLFWGCLYLGVLNDFDDLTYIFRNPYTDGLSWSNIRGAFTHSFVGNYAPVHILSYGVDYLFWKDDPWGYHLTNIVLHIGNAVLLYFFLCRLIRQQSISLIASLIFLIHPVQVESVAWLSERKNLLSATFFLFSFLIYIRLFPPSGGYDRSDEPVGKGVVYFFSFFFYLMALLTKSSVVVMPLLLLTYHRYYRGKGDIRKCWPAMTPFFMAAIVFSILTLRTQSGSVIGLFDGSIFSHIYMILYILGKYVRLLFFPVNLSFQYDVPSLAQGCSSSMAGPLIFLIIFTLWMVGVAKKKPGSFFWGLWFLICLLPVSQLVPIVTYMNDRYLYLPLIGFAVSTAGKLSTFRSVPKNEWTGLVLIAIPLLFYGTLTTRRIPVWATSRSLWMDAVSKAPGNHLPYVKIGAYHFREGKLDLALKEFQSSERIRPKYYNYEWIGNVYGKKHEWEKAIRYYRRSLSLFPENSKVLRNLGIALYNTGDMSSAVSSLQQAIRYSPGYVRPYLDLGDIYHQKGDEIRELQIYRELVRTCPEKVEGWIALAGYYAYHHAKEKSRKYWDIASAKAKRGSVLDQLKLETARGGLDGGG